MKYFKHMTSDMDDPFIHDLIEKFGGNGYLVYFGCISLICKETKKEFKDSNSFSISFLRRKFRISSTKVQQILDFCSTNGKLSLSFSKVSPEKVELSFPKLVEIQDEWSKKLRSRSGVAPKKFPLEVEVEVEVEVDKNIKDLNPCENAKNRVSLETKKPANKKSISKPTDPRIKTIIDFYHDEFLRTLGEKPHINGGKDCATIKRLLTTHPEVKIKSAITAMMKSDDPFIVSSGRSIGVLAGCFNKLIINRIAKNESEIAFDVLQEFAKGENNGGNTKRICGDNGNVINLWAEDYEAEG